MPNDNVDARLMPPLSPFELEGAHAYEKVERVVLTRNGVYLLQPGGGWVGVKPLSETDSRVKRSPPEGR